MVPILYRDDSLILCLKKPGILSQPAPGREESMLSLLSQQEGGEVFPVHRLDREAAGVMVFARTSAAAARLSEDIRLGRMEKEYLSVVQGIPLERAGTLRDLLFKDSARGRSYVVRRMRKGVKEASLSYRTVAERGAHTLVLIRLHTGRTHQIRVQFSSRGMPLLGDVRYGGERREGGAIALWSWRLKLPGHDVQALPQGPLWEAFAPLPSPQELLALWETELPPSPEGR